MYLLLNLPPSHLCFPLAHVFMAPLTPFSTQNLKIPLGCLNAYVQVRCRPPWQRETSPAPRFPPPQHDTEALRCIPGRLSTFTEVCVPQRGMQSRAKRSPCPRAWLRGRWKGLTGRVKQSMDYKYCHGKGLLLAKKMRGSQTLKGFTSALPSEGQVRG